MHKGVMIKSATDILKQKKKQKQDFINKHRQKNPDNQQHIIGSEISTESGDIIIIDNSIDYNDILLCHILPKVPAESIIRFKSVSKGWHSFLTTPMFARMHQEHHQNNHKLLFISNTTRPITFSSVDCEKLEDGFTSERHFPFEVDCPDQDVTIITSFNGMVCVGIKDKHSKYELKYSRLILWNPLTGDYKTLSETNSHKECYKASVRVSVLCYVSSEDDYKLLRVTKSCNVYIYSLKSDSWRKIEPTEEFHRLSCSLFDYNAFLNDKLYVLKMDNTDLYSVMRLDLKTGKVTEAETPFRKSEACLGFTVLRGCIYVWMRTYLNRKYSIDLWRMDGDGHGDWIRVVTFYETLAFDCWFMQPLHLMADGKWLMLHKQRLYITNPEKPNSLMWSYSSMVYKYKDTLMKIAPGGKYLETLVSPNQYMK